ncbi:MAG: helix-turn-helix transcriptional regulator [Deltaproteobacteria bacterium]|nr:helix-turn-helix transcriptional regulator [Deltaproteobacteria bacterium]
MRADAPGAIAGGQDDGLEQAERRTGILGAWRYLRAAEPDGSPALLWPVALAGALAIFVAADLVADIADGVPTIHLVIESLALLLCLAGVWGTGRQLHRALCRARDLHDTVERSRADLHRLGAEVEAMASGVRTMVDLHFTRWKLTTAEREVAVHVLRGLSYKEVAEARDTSEHTVRNQAYAIYRKAGLGSRTDMAAFFLEQLLAPRQPLLHAVADEAGAVSERAAAAH